MIYPGTSVDPKTQLAAQTDGVSLTDREDLTHNPEKYNQDREWMRAAFPDDHQLRNSYATAVLDPELCGKWKVRTRPDSS